MMVLDFKSIAQIAASRGLNTLLEGLVLAGLSWSGLRWLGARNSVTRFAVWFSTLLVIAGLPLLSFSSSNSPKFHRPGLALSGTWAAGLFTAWAVIASVLLLRLGFSLWHIYRLRNECREIDPQSLSPSLTSVLAESLRQLPRSRRVRVLVSDEVRVPTALGLFRPAVVLPTWTLRDLSADELKVIILHELAHLQRWDDWTNLGQKFVKAVFFFHPAVWWIDSRLALEREIACDDMVLEQAANARTYAASLVSVAEKVVAEKMRMGRALALAQSALGRVRELSQRIAQILDTERARTTRVWRPAVAIVGMLAVVTVGAMPYAPELISFQDKSQPLLSAGADGVGSSQIRITPVSWTGMGGRPYMVTGDASATHGGSARHSIVHGSEIESSPQVVPAKVTVHRKSRTAEVLIAKASNRSQATATLTVWHSSQFDAATSRVWTLTVWRIRSADGNQTVQETIVMNSL